MKKMSLRAMVNFLIEYLILNLNELNDTDTPTAFTEGEQIAYAECLEVISMWPGFKKFGITDIEKEFNIT